MRKWLLAVSSSVLALSLAGCAHQTGGGAYGVGYLDECQFGDDCYYGGPQYTCVFFQPAAAPARMEITVARHSRSTRVVGPRDEGPGTYGPGSSSATVSAPASVPAVAREPVVVASPSVDRGSPRVHN